MNRARVTLAAGLLALACLPASPAAADDALSYASNAGLGFGADLVTFSPMDASSLVDDGMGGGLVSAFSLGQEYGSAYALVADMSDSSAMAIDSADIARQSQEAADAKRRAALAGPQTQVGPDGCPVSVPAGTLRDGSASKGIYQLCADSVAQAPSAAAAGAIKFALRNLGAPYACGGAGRLEPYKFDCSSLVARAYHEGGGLSSAGDGWSPSTREMVPWDGSSLASWLTYVDPAQTRPGDLSLYDTGGTTYRHVVMILADGYMVHTNSCGDVAHVAAFRGFSNGFLVARRAVA